MAEFDKIVIVTQQTALEQLLERYTTVAQTQFYLTHSGGDFDSVEAAHRVYSQSRDTLAKALPRDVRHQFVERTFLPNFLFGDRDLVIVLGRDGLVVNVAKYLNGQPLLAFNPDPERIDGVLLPFHLNNVQISLALTLAEKFKVKNVTMGQVKLDTGQTLHAVNDFFIGQRTHLSARYQLKIGKKGEEQSSSGIIVSTGAGSTGWFRSVLTGAVGVVDHFSKQKHSASIRDHYRFDWESDHLMYSVREPFISRTSGAELVFGRIDRDHPLQIRSQMPANGVIFSDGIESDYLEFNSGRIAIVGVAEKKLKLVTSVG